MKTKLLLVSMLALSTVIASGKSLKQFRNNKLSQKSSLFELKQKANKIQVMNKSQSIQSGSVMQLDSIKSSYSYEESAWENNDISIQEYMSNGKLENQIHLYDMMGDGNFMEHYKYNYEYDANGNISKENYYNMDTADWELREIASYQYDDQGRMTELSYMWKEDGMWEDGGRGVITYGTDINEMVFEYKDDNGDYIIEEKIKIMLSNNIPVTTLYYDTNGGEELILEDSAVHIANNQGQIIEEHWYELDEESGTFYFDNKYTYGYDSNGNPILEEGYKFNTDTEKWDLSSQYKYTYDLDYEYKDNYYNIPRMLMYMENPDGVVNLLTSVESGYKESEDSEFMIVDKEMYIYSETTAQLEKTENKKVVLYPNPTADIIRFKAIDANAKFQLIDLQGRTVISQDINEYTEIPVSALTKGLYIYSISANNKREQGELIIK